MREECGVDKRAGEEERRTGVSARGGNGRTRVNWVAEMALAGRIIDGTCSMVFPRAGSREHHTRELGAFLFAAQ